MLAERREAAVGRRHLQRVHLVRTQHGRWKGVQRACDPHPVGGVHYVGGPLLHDELRVDGVDRMDRRLLERQHAACFPVVVVHGPDRGRVPARQRDVDVRGRGVDRLRRDALVQGGDEGERLERGPRLPPGRAARRQVELRDLAVPEIVAAADHREHRAGARIEHRHRAPWVVLEREDAVHGLLRLTLQPKVDRRGDAKAALEEQCVAVRVGGTERGVRQEPLLHVVDEERGGVGRGLANVQPQVLRPRSHVRRLVDPLLLKHLGEHQVASRHGLVRMEHGVVRRGRSDQARQKRALGERELVRRDREVRLGGGLDPVRALAEVDRVQVHREDLVLRVALLELEGEHRVLDLPRERPLVAGDRVLHELLGDGRASLDDPALLGVLDGGPDDRLHVHAGVLIEALVFDRDDGVAHRNRDVADRHDRAVLVGVQVGDVPALAVVDARGLRERGDRRLRVRDPRERDRAGAGEQADRGRADQTSGVGAPHPRVIDTN